MKHGPGGDFTPPDIKLSGSIRSDLGASSDGEDVYGTAFAPSPGIETRVQEQLETYGVSNQGGGAGPSSKPPTHASPPPEQTGSQKDSEPAHITEVGPGPRNVDVDDTKIKTMTNDEDEELFPEGESLLHGGGTKTVVFKDWTFATLFLGNMAVVLVMFVLFRLFGLGGSGGSSKHSVLGRDVPGALYMSGTIALGFAFLWLLVLKMAAQFLIKAAIVISLGVTLTMALFSFTSGGLWGGLGLLLLAGLEGLYAGYVWERSKMAAETIGVCVDFTSQYPAVFAVAAVSLFVQLIWLFFWSSTSYSTLAYFGASATGRLVSVYLLLMLFWGVQVLKNLVHVTIAGSFASWYYRFPYNQETHPTKDAFRRAITTSFGSVCMGSLVVAVVRTLRTMASMAHKGVQNRNAVLAAVFSRILMCLERLTQYFNVYAFVHVAVYGRSYVEAAKVASDIVRSSATTGVDALVNDDLVGTVLTMGAAVGGLACATIPAYTGMPTSALTFFLGLVLGYSIIMAVMAVIWSCVVTLFVCFASDPNSLYHTKPDQYRRLKAAWQARGGDLGAYTTVGPSGMGPDTADAGDASAAMELGYARPPIGPVPASSKGADSL